MLTLKQLLDKEKNIVTFNYDNFVSSWRPDNKIKEVIEVVRQEIKHKKVVFISYEHDKILHSTHWKFVGFENILGDHYYTNNWAISTPTSNNQFGKRQFQNLDFLIMVNNFNTEFNHENINHSKKVKHFLFLNGKSHSHRVKLTKKLLSNNLLYNSLWSFNDVNVAEKMLEDKYEWPEWRGKLINGYCDETRKIYYPQYNDTICSIVAETLDDPNHHFISEKTCKPIMAEHLFVILSGSGFLKHLKSLGFKTFSNFFDESYDECIDLDDRISKIVETLKYIVNCDFEKLYKDTQDIRKYNKHLFFKQEMYNDFNFQQIQKIKEFFSL